MTVCLGVSQVPGWRSNWATG